jgi:putative ABC transport system ATP-binding protein
MLRASGVTKSYARGGREVPVLRGVDLEVDAGELVAIVGPSGSGKTTLMQLLGGLDRVTSGSIELAGHRLEQYSDANLSAFRRRQLGFVFQFFNLLPSLSALENVALPLLLDARSLKQVAPKAEAMLEAVGLKHRMRSRPGELSGGEMQRVAIARALVADPVLILADEPTGNLDSNTGSSILELFQKLVRERNKTLVMVTHDPKAAAISDRVVSIADGLIASDTRFDSVSGVRTARKAA